MDPSSLVFEALGARGVSADVERVAGAPAVESSLILADARDRTTGLPDPQGRDRRLDLLAVLSHDVDDIVIELGDVTRTEVVPPPWGKRCVEQLLKRQVRHGHTTIEHGRTEPLQRTHDLLPLIDRAGIDGRDGDHMLPDEIRRQA